MADVIETAKFLKELEDQAVKNISATVTSKDNGLHFSGFCISKNSNIRNSVDWYISIWLNGVESRLKDEVDLRAAYDPESIKKVVAKSVSDKLMKYIEAEIYANIQKL